jgi:hypothetical protein
MLDIARLGIEIDARQVRDGDRALDDFTRTGARAEQQTDRTNAAFDRMKKMAAVVAGAIAAMGVYEAIKEATILAARYNELGVVMGVLGRNAGISGAQLAATEAALRKTGISATQSRDAIGKLISANIDLSKASALARLAQDAAVIGGMNSSEAFASLIKGIQSAEKETLQTLGLNVNFQQSYEKLAKSIGKKTDALTESEKTQAAVNAALEKAPTIAGAYEASLTNAGKQMRSMSRYIEDLKVQLGQPFQNPFEGIIGASTSALKVLSENVTTIRAAMEATIKAIGPAVKITAAYFAIFVAAPAIYAATVAALTPLVHTLAVYAMNVAIGQANTIGLNTALFGTSVAAQLASGSLTKLGLAANLLFAAFAGWQIGKYLDEQFVEVRVAGEVMAGGLLTAWERVKFGAKVAFDAITLVARNTITGIMGLFAGIWEGAAKGLRMIGKDGAADEVEALAGRFRKAADAQGTFAGRTAESRAEMEKNLKVIDQDTDRRVTAALAQDKLSEATRGATATAKTAAKEKKELTDAEKKAIETAAKNAREYIASLEQQERALGATESQMRMMAAAAEAAKAPTAALRLKIMEQAVALDKATLAYEEKTAAEKRAAEAQKAIDDGVNAIWDEVRALDAQIEGYNKSAKAATLAAAAKVQAQLLSAELSEEETRGLEMKLAALNALAAKQNQVASIKTKVEGPQKLLDVMEALSDASQDAAANMASAFGSVGEALGGLITSMATYERSQAAIAKQLQSSLDEAEKGDDPKAAAKARAEAARASAAAQMKSYGDMAKAGKSFFKENSAGYRAMEGAEKSFRAFELALSLKSMLEKSGLVQAFTGLFVASKATETAATVASVAPDVAASQVKGQAAAAAGVAGQAQGDPYTAWGRMAAMAAVMAALGFAVSGGSKPDTTAADRQKAQGTGTVMGDSSAKSQSIKRAIELSAANSNIELNYTAGMLRALLSIESAMSGLGSLVMRNGDVGGALPGDQKGGVSKFANEGIIGGINKLLVGGDWWGNALYKIGNAVFGGKVSAIDGGLTAGATTIGGARAGQFNAQSYVDTKKDGGLFRSDKYSTALTNLSAETNQQFALVITNMADAVEAAAQLLGEGEGFSGEIENFVVNLGKISTKGLTGEEIQKALEAQFSMVGDQIAAQAVGGLAQFQQVGEGYFETLVRVANNYANLDAVLAATGDTFGATGLSSIAARERLIELSGGIDELASKSASFAENFLTEAQRLAPIQEDVTLKLSAMGLSALDSRDKFAAYVLALDKSIPAQQDQYVALMNLQDAFAKTHAATVDLSKSEQEIADERADLQGQLDDLLLSTAEKAAKARAALDPMNRVLYDQVQLARDATEAHDAAAESLKSLSDEYRGFAKGLEAFGLSLVTGSLSTLNIGGQEQAARAQYEKTAAAALAGDKGALADFEKVAGQFLTLSQKANGGDSTYVRDMQNVLALTDKLASYATDRADAAMMQLAAAERSAKGIEELVAIMRSSEATLAALATKPPADRGPLTSVDNGNALRDEMRALADSIRTSSQAAVTSAEKMAALQAQENARVTLAGAQVVATAVTTTNRARATARNTAATLDIA